MSTKDDFQAALDTGPDDRRTRLVFADWLQDHGDPRAGGYQALGTLRVCPYPMKWARRRWAGYTRTDLTGNPAAGFGGEAFGARLPPDWFARLRAGNQLPDWKPTWWAYWRTRREAEDAAARAFAKLPPERRTELLAGVGATAGKPSPPRPRARTGKKPAPKKGKGKK